MGSQNIFKMQHWTEKLQDGRILFQYSIEYWKRKQARKKQLEESFAGILYEIQELENDFIRQAIEKGYTQEEILAAQKEI